jgi:hypothetical protein
MSIGVRSWSAALALALGLLSPAVLPAQVGDPLTDTRARLAVEAQRVEREFADGRSAAYKLVRSSSPDTAGAVIRLNAILQTLRNDEALDPKRREQLIVTVKWDMNKVREIAAENRRPGTVGDDIARTIRSDIRRADTERRETEPKRTVSDADRILGSRGKVVADARDIRRDAGERFSSADRSIDKSASGPIGDYSFMKAEDWRRLSERRSPAAKLTARERTVLAALNSTISVEFRENTFQQAIQYIEKLTGETIVLDGEALKEAGVTEEGTQVNLRLKSTSRTVLKRLLADLGLTYIVKGGHIQVTSIARAREETTVRTYYVGDLAPLVGATYGPIVNQFAMTEAANRLITLITQTVETKSWQVNNPDAPGTIAYDPISQSLIIKQTAEFHYMMGGGR